MTQLTNREKNDLARAVARLFEPCATNDVTSESHDWQLLCIQSLVGSAGVPIGYVELKDRGTRILDVKLNVARTPYGMRFSGTTRRHVEAANVVLRALGGQAVVSTGDLPDAVPAEFEHAHERLLHMVTSFIESRPFYPEDSPSPSVEAATLAHDVLVGFEKNPLLRDLWKLEARDRDASDEATPATVAKGLRTAVTILGRFTPRDPAVVDGEMTIYHQIRQLLDHLGDRTGMTL